MAVVMLTVHKYQFNTDGFHAVINRPIQPLSVQLQDDWITLWMLVDTEAQSKIDIIVTGTGHPVEKGLKYCGTVQWPPFVWHVWIPNDQLGTLVE